MGAGTGKATVVFAARGIPLVCIEPDPRMAGVLHRNTASYPGVRVQPGSFEDWDPGGRRYGLLFAGQSWHWLDRQRRWDLAYGALAPGGALALFWNRHQVIDAGLHGALAQLSARYGIVDPPHAHLAGPQRAAVPVPGPGRTAKPGWEPPGRGSRPAGRSPDSRSGPGKSRK